MDARFLRSAYRQDQYPPPDRAEVAIAGRSNVGKSSLINALVRRRNLAKTSARPGRTQSINFYLLNNEIYLVDLPGYGYAKVPLKVKASWKQMVEIYLNTRFNLKAVVVILDIRRDPTVSDKDLLEWLEHHRLDVILALTKADKISKSQAHGRAEAVIHEFRSMKLHGPILFSARTGQGREELLSCIVEVAGAKTERNRDRKS